MKQFTASIFFLCAAAFSASAQRSAIRLQQNPVFAEWEEKPSLQPTPQEYANDPAYYILNSTHKDYKYEGRHITEYYTLHRIIKVLDELGIERFNKIAIQVPHYAKILTLKARTILPDGKVYNIPDSMIKTTYNESGMFEVDIALEGVQKNAEIEFLLKEIRQASFAGSQVMQFPEPVQHTWFVMTYPKEMHYEEKGYNGFPDATDTMRKGTTRREISIYVANIPALEHEPNSFYDLYRMRAEYRLNYFYDEGDEIVKLDTWDDHAKEIHNDFYKLTNDERAAASKYISTLGVTTTGTDIENIKKIENGIKNSIVLNNAIFGLHADNLDTIIAKKEATTDGYIKLFAACFTAAGVPHELGLTGDKYETSFDKDFENWALLDDYVFYFPTLKKFLSPTNVYYRYPIVPDDIAGNKGVFCMIPPDGHPTGPLSEVLTITSLPASENQNNITANVTFDKEMNPTVAVTYGFSGYSATGMRTSVVLKSQDQRNDFLKKAVVIADKPEDIIKYAVANEAFDNYYSNKPLEISATVNAPQLIEKAGNRYLFKLGAIIGKQDEFYKKTERKLPVDLNYPNSENRTITMEIPKGYKILNPGVLRKQADYVDDNGKTAAAFTSDYKIEKNKLVVTIHEFYNHTHYNLNEFERYRNIVNTAADFSKVALVLAKK